MSLAPKSVAGRHASPGRLELGGLPQLPEWLPIALITGSVVALSLLFLWPSFAAFPMDDTYIHFVYARHLADRGLLFFNFPNEAGVGTTSILWVLLLAAGLKLGGLAISLSHCRDYAVAVVIAEPEAA